MDGEPPTNTINNTYNIMTLQETENQTRLRRSKEALAAAREKEADAIRALALARQAVQTEKARYEKLFLAEERAEYDRRKNG